MIKLVVRFLIFLVAIGAMAIICWAGVWYLGQRGEGDYAEISLAGEQSDREPQSAQDFLLGLYLQFRQNELDVALSDDDTVVQFTIELGESALTVAQHLEEMHLIADARLFRTFLRYHGIDNTLEAGTYQLRRNMTIPEIAQVLQRARADDVIIVIREGWRAEETAEALERQGIMGGDLFMAAVRQGTVVDHPLLADRPPGASYEGYLYPDTYRLPVDALPEDLIRRMLDNLAARLPSDYQQLADAQGLTLYQVLTVASIVEREAVIADERPQIASVYLNRIKVGMHLNADPTVQYAMGYQPESGQWWKTPVTLEEYAAVASPYNTYLYTGLPPGPICSPRIDSIIAVLQPAPTDYLYFVARGDGSHVFAYTLEEHEENIRLYQGR